MKPSYCTQNDGRCDICSLVSYNRDCANNPLPRTKKRQITRGWSATLANYDGHKGPVTINAVISQIPDALRKQLTGAQLGMVMSAINKAYHAGLTARSHTNIGISDDCAWLPWNQILVPVAALKAIIKNGNRYMLDYTENE
jgi:hypothetical protein